MADLFQDTDAGSDANDGTTWALAKLTIEGLLAVMSAGDRGWIQGAASDAVAGNRSITSPGTAANPCIITGVVDGTTNEPPILSDLAVTLPLISAPNAGNDLIFAGFSTWVNIHLSTNDKLTIGQRVEITIINGKMTMQDDAVNQTAMLTLIDSVLETIANSASFLTLDLTMIGGSILSTTAATLTDGIVNAFGASNCELIGVDISGRGTTAIVGNETASNDVVLRNCKIPAVFNLFASAPTGLGTVECIGCSDTTSVSATDSIQDYEYQDTHGTVLLDVTAVRTGGADDDATGAYSYGLTPAASSTLESSASSLKSRWMSVWLDGGVNTLTVYIANDSASTDYNEDEVWVEFYTPDVGDTAQYDQNFDPADARLFASSTAVTDDTGSTWGTGGNNHQKMSVTVTTGYTGWAYARLHLAKRSATPDTLFLDPRIEVS